MCPIYQLKCPNCEFEDEILTKTTRCRRILCPKCGQARLEKIISPSNFILNGRNWAKDGYGLKKPNKRKPKRS